MYSTNTPPLCRTTSWHEPPYRPMRIARRADGFERLPGVSLPGAGITHRRAALAGARSFRIDARGNARTAPPFHLNTVRHRQRRGVASNQ
jgi:hypothetical protein